MRFVSISPVFVAGDKDKESRTSMQTLAVTNIYVQSLHNVHPSTFFTQPGQALEKVCIGAQNNQGLVT